MGTRHVVGNLRRTASGYSFAYRDPLPSSDSGFALLPEFRSMRTEADPYVAAYLFPTFAQRVPSPKRPDRAQPLASWGVKNPDDPLEVLAKSGGVQMTDRIELAEYRDEDDALGTPLEFRVAGATYHAPPADVREGDALELKREPGNPRDPRATLVLVRDGRTLGYVPRQYAKMIARLLDDGATLQAVALRRLALPPEGGRWVARVSRSAAASVPARERWQGDRRLSVLPVITDS